MPCAKITRSAAVWNLAGPPRNVPLTPDGNKVAAAVMATSADAPPTPLVQVFAVATGKELMGLAGHAGPVHALAFHTDNRTLVSASEDKTVRLSDVGVLRAWQAHPGGVA